MQPVKRNSSSRWAVFTIAFGALFVLGSCVGLVIAFAPAIPTMLLGNFDLPALLAASNEGSLIGGAVFTVTFLIVGFVAISVGAWMLVARARLTRPDVALSNQSPKVGEIVTLRYAQTFRTATDVQGIWYQLVLREQATYGRGTDRVTARHDNVVQQYQLPARHFRAGEGFQEQRQFQTVGMHSFDASNNKLHWLIHVEVQMTGWPAFKEEYPLQVSAELAS